MPAGGWGSGVHLRMNININRDNYIYTHKCMHTEGEREIELQDREIDYISHPPYQMPAGGWGSRIDLCMYIYIYRKSINSIVN